MGAQIQTKADVGLDPSRLSASTDRGQAFSASRATAALLGVPSLASLSIEQETTYSKQMGSALWAELKSLAKEKDAELFYQGILQLGGRLQIRNQGEWALKLYALAADQAFSPEQALQAKKSIAALEGRGEIGARAEVLLSRFGHDMRDPVLIAPMIVGSSVGGVVRGLGLGRLAAAPAAWYSRGFGARFTAGSLAFAAEVPAFVASGRALRGLGSQPQAGWGHDFSTGALSLGAIKLFSLAGKQGLAQMHGINEWGAITRGAALAPYSHPFVQQASLFGGLMVSHWAETQLGLRPKVDGATAVTDTFASMLTLGAGMRLGHGLLGRGYAGKMSELEWRTQSLSKAISLPKLELPRLSAQNAAAASGLGFFLQSNLAHAADHSGRWNSQSVAATILSSLVVGGGIAYGIYRIRRSYVAPSGPIRRLDALKEDIPTMLPARLAKEASRAQALLQESSVGDRRGDAETVEAAAKFLEGSLPRLEKKQRAEVFTALIDMTMNGKENFAAPGLAILKRTFHLLDPATREALLDKVHLGTRIRRPDKAVTAFFLLSALAKDLSEIKRREVFLKAMGALQFQEENLSNNAKLLHKQRSLLRELRDFLDKERQEQVRELNDELYDLEKDPAGGWIPGLRGMRIATLRNLVTNPKEPAASELLQRFMKESEDPEAKHFDLQDALVQAHKLKELFEEENGYRPPDFNQEFELRAHLNEPAMREYLRDGHAYIKMVGPEGIREALAESLLGKGK